MRGTQRKVVYVKNLNSPIYDEVYFILKSGIDTSSDGENFTRDMSSEADRIIEEQIGIRKKIKFAKHLFEILSFLSGALITALAVILFS